MNKVLLIIIIISNQFLSAKTEINTSFLSNDKIVKSLLHSNQTNNNSMTNFKPSLVVGFADSNEVRIIERDTLINGDIAVVNNGKLIIRNSLFLLFGNIYLNNNATIELDTCRINILQNYAYQFSCTVVNNAQLLFNKVDFQSNRNSWGLAFANSAKLKTSNSKITNGFITNSLSDSAVIDITNSDNPGEFIISNNSSLHFTNTNYFLIWLTLNSGSNVAMSLPSDSLIITWELQKQPNISGINFNVKIDNSTNANWCFLSYAGSKTQFTNTTFRACGIMLSSPDSACISNIINNSKYDKLVFNLKDRELSLTNSSVGAWNFYGMSKSNFTLQNCIFGEMIAFDTSRVNISNSKGSALPRTERKGAKMDFYTRRRQCGSGREEERSSCSPSLFSLHSTGKKTLLFSLLLLPPAPSLELVGDLAQAVGRLAVGGLGELLGLLNSFFFF